MWYEFRQNNSGGDFHSDDDVAHYVWVEADNAAEANSKARDVGVYFDGCEYGTDCPCCGDRWYQVDEDDAESFPSGYVYSHETGARKVDDFQLVANSHSLASDGECVVILYHADGSVSRFKKGEKSHAALV